VPSRHLLIVAVVGLFSTASAGTIYVDDDNCPGPGDGSKLNPYCSIQAAIDNAVDTDEIIDAGGGLVAVTCHNGEGPETVLDGFTVTGTHACVVEYNAGMTNFGSDPTVTNCIFTGNMGGGGMYNSDSSPTVTNCVFAGNHAGFISAGAADPMDCCVAHGTPGCDDPPGCEELVCSIDPWCCEVEWDQICVDEAFTYCSGCDCHIQSGGGMRNVYGGHPFIAQCTFVDNSTDGEGGGIYDATASTTIIDCVFEGNIAVGAGGAISTAGSGSKVILNCTFIANTSIGAGGAVMVIETNLTISNCTFSGNTVPFGSGGAIYNYGGSPTVTGCTFSGNFAGRYEGYGGKGGAMFNWAYSSPTVVNCTFRGNTAHASGGAISSRRSSPTVANCVFSGNTAGAAGGGMSSNESSSTVVNCTLSGNSALSGNALAFDSHEQQSPSDILMANCILWDGGDEIWNHDGSTINITYSNVEGGYPGTGNMDTDPMCVDPANGDLHLLRGSPCIDAGDNTAVPPGIRRDLDGNPRIVVGSARFFLGAGPFVDMGAYEFQFGPLDRILSGVSGGRTRPAGP
jgi:predicted outer membrane repeat protein